MSKKRTRGKYTRHLPHNCERGWSIPQRLAYYSRPDPLSGCHIWQGHLRDGYGSLYSGFKQRYAHRLAWEVKYGPIPDGFVVRHRCNVRRCCNPDHLVLGTRAENNGDQKAANVRIADARLATARGVPGSHPDMAPIRIFVRGVEMTGDIVIKLADPELTKAARFPTAARTARAKRRPASRAA